MCPFLILVIVAITWEARYGCGYMDSLSLGSTAVVLTYLASSNYYCCSWWSTAQARGYATTRSTAAADRLLSHARCRDEETIDHLLS
jgi:hypothetical protein